MPTFHQNNKSSKMNRRGWFLWKLPSKMIDTTQHCPKKTSTLRGVFEGHPHRLQNCWTEFWYLLIFWTRSGAKGLLSIRTTKLVKWMGGIGFSENNLAKWTGEWKSSKKQVATWMGGVDFSENDLAKWTILLNIVQRKHQLCEACLKVTLTVCRTVERHFEIFWYFELAPEPKAYFLLEQQN